MGDGYRSPQIDSLGGFLVLHLRGWRLGLYLFGFAVHFYSKVTASASIDPHQGGISVLCSYRIPSTREAADVTFLCALVRVLEPNGGRPPLEPGATPAEG